MNPILKKPSGFRTFGAGLTTQAVLSGGSFVVGFILIRFTDDLQYSYYVLAYNGLLLGTTILGSFVQPLIVTGLASSDLNGRRNLVGGLLLAARKWIPVLCVLGLLATIGGSLTGALSPEQLYVCVALFVSIWAVLQRDLLRFFLFAYRRPGELLKADAVYTALLIAGASVCVLTSHAAAVGIASVGVAALAARHLLGRSLWQHEPWNPEAAATTWQEMMRLGVWSFAGAAIHWLLGQGYSYVAATTGGVREVAALAGTRLTMSPIFILSSGVSALLFPMVAHWLQNLGPRAAFHKMLPLIAGLVVAAIAYALTLWIMREWIFGTVLRKDFFARDQLLLLWGAIYIVALVRDQVASLLFALKKFRAATLSSASSVFIWAAVSYLTIPHFGASGAVVGILVAELGNLTTLLTLIRREMNAPAGPTETA